MRELFDGQVRRLLGHTDPMLGAEAGAKYDAMFTHIVNLALHQHRKNMD